MSASVTLAAVVLAGVGACYSGPINMAPRITIMATTSLARGGVATFKAEVSDPDNDPVTVEWVHAATACVPEPPAQAIRMTGPSYTVTEPDTDGIFCVWATARDRYGASTRAEPLEIRPDNGAPDVVLSATLESPEKRFPPPTFPLYRSIRLDASGSDDPDRDQLEYEWKLVSGPDLPLFHDCLEGESASVRCLTPKLPGSYKVRVTVRDTHGGQSDATETLAVNPDQLPCLETTDPLRTAWMVSNRPDQARKIIVNTVTDDGNPWPRRPELGLEDPKFRWFVSMGPKADALQLLTAEGVYYEIPAFSHNVGDEVKVRVEVFDRNKAEIEDRLFTCGDKDVCGVDGCIQRMTWLITYGE